MRRMDRRRFVVASAAAAANWKSLGAVAQSGMPEAAGPAATLTLHPEQVGPTMPKNFIGLSYETQQLSEPAFFSAANHGLVAQLRKLAPAGVLRLGGNTSDYGYWKPTPSSVAPPRAARPYKVGDPPPDLTYAVTPEAVHNLNAFLDATGWTCLYGINLGTNTPALAAEEAAFAAKTLGAKLEYLQVGNEADRFGSTIRDPKTWNAEAFLEEWLRFAEAILARVPNAKFGMPDIASNAQWFGVLGDRLATNPIKAHIDCMTHHYYIGGPPSDPTMTVDRILTTDPRVAKDAALVRGAAEKLGTKWRMTEGNTCYRGGKPGVSDVFAAGLWAADYLLTLASLGYSGVNLHGGDGQMVANSLGGKLPGDELVTDDPARHPHPYYTPVAHIGSAYVAQPVSLGMRFAGWFAGATLVPVTFDAGGVRATAYAAKRGSELLVGVINKDASQALRVRLPKMPHAAEGFSADSLTATAVQEQAVKLVPGAEQTVGAHAMVLFRMQG